jgi:prepilin-type N-terminal cleavage/methylation domain-containing protein
MRNSKGFSFSELLIVIAIVLIIAAIAIPNLAKKKQEPQPIADGTGQRFTLDLKEQHGYYTFNVWHDNVSGQEIVCVTGYREPSCWQETAPAPKVPGPEGPVGAGPR